MPETEKKNDLDFTGERLIPGKTDFALLEQHVARYRFALEYAKNADVLDAACGAGYGCFILSTAAKNVTGIDLNPDAIEHSRKNYSQDKIRFTVADVLSMPFPDESFELVVAYEIFEHVADTSKFLGELKRVTRKNGKIIISTPNAEYLKSTVRNPFHVKEYKLDEFQSIISGVFKNNFKIIGQTAFSPTKGFWRNYIRIKKMLGIGPIMKKSPGVLKSPEELLTMKLSSRFSDANLREAEFFIALINI